MKLPHLSKSALVTRDGSLALLLFLLLSLTSVTLVMPLTLSCINCLSALSIIFLALTDQGINIHPDKQSNFKPKHWQVQPKSYMGQSSF